MDNLSKEQLAEITSLLPDPAFILSGNGRYLAYLGGVDHLSYHDGSPLVGHNLKDVLPADIAAWFQDKIDQALSQHCIQTVEYDLNVAEVRGVDHTVGPEGVLRFEGKIVPLQSLFDGEKAVMLLTRNITGRYQLEQQLRILSETDSLTGFYNRRFLLDKLKTKLQPNRRKQWPASLIFIDIDFFKPVNDEHGHLVGDEVLRVTCDRIKSQLRADDIPARIGGEEFAILLPHTPLEEAMLVAERIRKAIADENLQALEQQLSLTVSAGVSQLIEGDSVGAALTRADKALYQAKSFGRNQVRQA